MMKEPTYAKDESNQKRLLVMYLVLCICLSVYLIILIKRAGVNIPFADELKFTFIYNSVVEGNFPNISELLKPHNGHLYFIPYLLIYSALKTGTSLIFLMYLQVFLLLLSALFVGYKSVTINANFDLKIITLLIIGFSILSPRHWENLYWSLQISVAVGFLCTVLSLFFLSNFIQFYSKKDLILSTLFSSISLFSFGGGIITFVMVFLTLIIFQISYTIKNKKYSLFIFVFIWGSFTLFTLLYSFSLNSKLPQFPSISLYLYFKHFIFMLANTVCFFRDNLSYTYISEYFSYFFGLLILILTILHCCPK